MPTRGPNVDQYSTPERVAKALLDSLRGEKGAELAIQTAAEILVARWSHGFLSGRESWRNALLHGERAGAWELTVNELAAPTRQPLSAPLLAQVTADALSRVARVLDAVEDEIRESRHYLSDVFESLLILRSDSLSRAGMGQGSSPLVAQLMNHVVSGALRVVDPACGLGNALFDSGARSVSGYEINQSLVDLASLRFEIADKSADLRQADWLGNAHTERWDAVVLEPPFGMKAPDRFAPGQEEFPLPRTGNFAWLFSGLAALAPSGRAAVLLPLASLFDRDKEARRSLIDSGHVEAVVMLPAGATMGTSIQTALWVLRREPDLSKSGRILLARADALGSPSDRAGNLTAESVALFDERLANQMEARDKVLGALSEWRELSALTASTPPWVARVVDVEAIASDDHSIVLERYLSAPPEEVEVRPTSPYRGIGTMRIKNFKAFDEASSEIRLAPLTLIFGRNSAGKSSIIQALLLLKQSVGAGVFMPSGPQFDGGTFTGLIHRQDDQRQLSIGLSYASSASLDSAVSIPNPAWERSLDFTFAFSGDAVELEHLDYGLDTERFRFRADDESDGRETLMRLDVASAIELVRKSTGPEATFPPVKPIPRAASSVARGFARLRSEFASVDRDGLVITGRGEVPFDLGRSSTRPGLEQSYLNRGWKSIQAISDETRSMLARLVYLGPLREAPARFSAAGMSSTSTDIARFLLDNKSEARDVSQWIARMGMPYELNAFSLRSVPGAHVIGDLIAISLRHNESGVTLSPADVGFGMSQVLPIVVELSARTESTVLIEQPEIHLHPAMQSELADLLIESSKEEGRANQVIAETHSEHIMLRVQRRIREGSLSAADVSVIYVDQDAQGRATVQRLRIDGNGEFLDEWPNGFFAQRFDELFGGLL
jgi:AAA domain, putative AbiEii toxin, Type IV TA system/N-6 DNA Methylase/Protein of unknown function (DUF3696)